MADEAQGPDYREPVVNLVALPPHEVPDRNGVRQTYVWLVFHGVARAAEITKPFPDEERYFVFAFNGRRGWIRGGLLDAMALAADLCASNTTVVRDGSKPV